MQHHDSQWMLVGALSTILVGGLYFFFSPTRNQEKEVEVQHPIVEEQQGIPEHFVRRLTDGMYIDPEAKPTQVYGVMVENSAEAWPLEGISNARMVVEAPVEGNIPRFLVFFDNTSNVEKIGPVRSARPYYVEWARGLDLMYAHVGGSPEGLALIKTLGVKDLNEFYNANSYWRSTDRYAPHNVYTSTELLEESYEAKEFDEQEIQSFFSYKDDEPIESDSENLITSITVPISTPGSLYDAGWEYDFDRNAYRRLQNNKEQFDQDDDEVWAKNVLVFFTDIATIDDEGRKRLRTEGEGDGLAFFDGRETDIVWEKASGQEHFVIKQPETSEVIHVNAGMTWVEVVSEGTSVTRRGIEEDE